MEVNLVFRLLFEDCGRAVPELRHEDIFDVCVWRCSLSESGEVFADVGDYGVIIPFFFPR